MLDALKNLYRSEPAVINALVTGALLALASVFGVVLDKVSVGTYVAGGLALLLGAGYATRRVVRPVKSKR